MSTRHKKEVQVVSNVFSVCLCICIVSIHMCTIGWICCLIEGWTTAKAVII
jgi:hypothetical protein